VPKPGKTLLSGNVAHRDEEDMTDLSPTDHDFLWGIFHFGGYSNSRIATLATGISRRKTLDRLNWLVKHRYLRKILTDFRRTTPHVFRVTAKTCRLFGSRDSYLRKLHGGEYVARALLKYLFDIEHRGLPFIISNQDRISALSEAGYTQEMVPYKENLSNRKAQSTRVYWIEELMVLHDGRIHLFFIDREPRNAYNQLRVLFKAYERILGQDHTKLRFYIVVANDWRKRQYLRVIRRGFVFPVDRPRDSATESYEDFVQRVTGTKGRPKDHLSLRDIHLKLVQTKTDVF
jgi:hypothetical protein